MLYHSSHAHLIRIPAGYNSIILVNDRGEDRKETLDNGVERTEENKEEICNDLTLNLVRHSFAQK